MNHEMRRYKHQELDKRFGTQLVEVLAGGESNTFILGEGFFVNSAKFSLYSFCILSLQIKSQA